jgi:membrane-associated protein
VPFVHSTLVAPMVAALGILDPEQLISRGGYLLIFAIVFAESGLLIGFFLPGDSLLFTAGMFAGGAFASKLPNVQFNIWILVIGIFIAAVAGDQVGYQFGLRVGPAIFRRPNSRLFKHENVEKAQEFFDKHGPNAIVLARFVPIVRTFCPIVAGVGRMDRATFTRYNLVGGLLWGVGVTLLGYFLGGFDVVKDNFEIAILLVVAVSALPIVVEVVRARRHRTADGVGSGPQV